MEWRAMVAADLPRVLEIADQVHVDFPESPVVFAEKHRLYPQGCFVLDIDGETVGYMIAHGWLAGKTPALDMLLGGIPAAADTLYIHDLALLPAARGKRAPDACMALLVAEAQRAGFKTMSLTAVNGSVGFWQKHGFVLVKKDHISDELASYGDEAYSMQRDLSGI